MPNDGVERRIQACARCGQRLFDYFYSPDGHFGVVDLPGEGRDHPGRGTSEVRCPTCGARYRLLERLDGRGQPVGRIGGES